MSNERKSLQLSFTTHELPPFYYISVEMWPPILVRGLGFVKQSCYKGAFGACMNPSSDPDLLFQECHHVFPPPPKKSYVDERSVGSDAGTSQH